MLIAEEELRSTDYRYLNLQDRSVAMAALQQQARRDHEEAARAHEHKLVKVSGLLRLPKAARAAAHDRAHMRARRRRGTSTRYHTT